MTKQVQRRRGTSTQHTSFTGADGEISVNTTNKSVHVHDGVTAGGVEAARADLTNVSDANLNAAFSGNTVAALTITSATINGGTITGITDLAVADGGTGASTAATARTNLGAAPSASPAFTGQASFADGSAAAPSIAHTGDLNAGLFFPAADIVAVSTAGTERMRIDSSGNVGIGTASPAATAGYLALHVNGVTAAQIRVTNSTTGATATDGLVLANDVSAAYLFNYEATPLVFATSGSERMRIDASGNVGIGVTPSAWGGFKSLEFPGAFYGSNSGGTGLWWGQNTYYNGTNWIYKTTAAASYHEVVGNVFRWYAAPSGTAGNAVTFTQAMTLDASGRLGIGTTSPTARLSVTGTGTTAGVRVDGLGTSQVQDFYAVRNGSTTIHAGPNLTFQNPSGGTTYSTSLQMGPTGETLFFNYNGSTWNERARIDASGNLLVGATSNNSNPVRGWFAAPSAGIAGGFYNPSTGAVNQVLFVNPNGAVGSVQTNGFNTTYTSASDYRLKENVWPMQNALDTVAQLNPVTYTWKADGSAGQGFIAHELQAVVPDCVTGEKDAVDADGKPQYQGVDTSFLVATLVKAIQELTARVAELENR